MKVTGARYKSNKNGRQPPQNIRIKKLSRPFRPEPVSATGIQGMQIHGKELIASEHKEKRDSSMPLYEMQKRTGTQEDDLQTASILKKKNLITADGSTAAESSLGQSDESYPRLQQYYKDKPGFKHLKGHEGLEAQLQKRQQQKFYMEQLKEQIREKEQRTTSAGKNTSQSLGICGSGIYKLDHSKRIPPEPFAPPAQDEKSPAKEMAEHTPTTITGSHRRQLQLEAMGNPFTRDEKQALRQKREAQKLQMKCDLEQQIAERQKAKEEERKKLLDPEAVRHKKAPSSEVTSKRLSEANLCIERAATSNQPPTQEKMEFERPAEEAVKETAKEDERWEILKSQIENLNKEKQELLKKLEIKDNVISTLNTTNTKKPNSIPQSRMTRIKHKVIAASADNKRKEERKIKEQSFYKANPKISKTIDKKPQIEHTQKPNRNIGKAVSTISPGKGKLDPLPKESTKKESIGEAGRNLDNDCQSCLIFPEKDGTFILPQEKPPCSDENKLTFSEKFPEDELEQLIKDYNNSRKSYISKVTEKLSSYGNNSPPFPPLLPEINPTTEWDSSISKNVFTNSMSPTVYSPMYGAVAKPVRKAMSGAPIRPVEHYTSNIANIVHKTRAINSAYYQSRGEAINVIRHMAADSTTMTGFTSNSKNKFPREVFSLGVRSKKSQA